MMFDFGLGSRINVLILHGCTHAWIDEKCTSVGGTNKEYFRNL